MIYDEPTIENVRARSSLIQLVGERAEIKQSGRNFTACCPFHSEKTPSFHINEEEGLYYCFGCGKKGNTFTFVMETRGLTFPESVRFLASRAGIVLPENSTFNKKNLASREKAGREKSIDKKVVSIVANIYEDSLWNSNIKEGRDFLVKRSVNIDVAKRFRVGFAPNAYKSEGKLIDLIAKNFVVSDAVSKDDIFRSLVSVGLLRDKNSSANKSNEQIGYRELFSDRVTFPITRSDNSIIAFGGRTLKDAPEIPKYINSPESSIFEKRKSFFGLGPSFQSAQKKKVVHIVEGYLDVISFSQLGIDNTIAVCGTALTEDHAKILSRFTKRVVLIFDGDKAGRLAAGRSFESFLNSGVDLVPVFLPEGEDPDSITKGRSESEVLSIIEQSKGDLLKLYIELAASEVRGLQRGELISNIGLSLSELSATEIGEVGKKIATTFAKINNPIELDLRTKSLSEYLGVSNKSILEMIKEQKDSLRKYENKKESNIPSAPLNSTTNISTSIKEKIISDDVESAIISSSKTDIVIDNLKRQFLIAVLVQPRIILSELLPEDLTFVLVDPKVNRLVNRLRDLYKENNTLVSLHMALEEKELREKVLAQLYGVLVECGLENEGLLDEAIKQLATGGAQYQEFGASLINTVKRVSILKDLDKLRNDEALGSDKVSIAQEKLLKKRLLTKEKGKS